jgi:type II secretory pathway pseudopilin PulG
VAKKELHCNMKIKKKYYTLLELVVSMGVFAILLLVVSMIFSTAQRAWTQSNAKAEVFENARVAMDMITRDTQSITSRYKGYKTPFWYKPKSGTSAYSNELINFVANISGYNKPCEVKYQLYYSNDLSGNSAGFLNRSITYNGASKKRWNFKNNYTAGPTTSNPAVLAFTADNTSSLYPQADGLIQYVTNLTFVCYDETGNSITGIIETSNPDDLIIPFSIEISLSLLDKDSWKKWVELAGTVTGESVEAEAFRKKHERTFTKTILIGDRGQYD